MSRIRIERPNDTTGISVDGLSENGSVSGFESIADPYYFDDKTSHEFFFGDMPFEDSDPDRTEQFSCEAPAPSEPNTSDTSMPDAEMAELKQKVEQLAICNSELQSKLASQSALFASQTAGFELNAEKTGFKA